MKKLTLTIAFTVISLACYSQTEYTVSKITYRTFYANGSTSSEPFKTVTSKTLVYLYNNALVVSGGVNFYFKFARKITVTNQGEANFTAWNATDRNGDECLVSVKDFGTYSKIALQWLKSGRLIMIETL